VILPKRAHNSNFTSKSMAKKLRKNKIFGKRVQDDLGKQLDDDATVFSNLWLIH